LVGHSLIGKEKGWGGVAVVHQMVDYFRQPGYFATSSLSRVLVHTQDNPHLYIFGSDLR